MAVAGWERGASEVGRGDGHGGRGERRFLGGSFERRKELSR